MKKILIAFLLFGTGVLYAQNDNLMNFNGHWYAPNASGLDKEALKYHVLLKEKSSFDSMSASLDVFVNRTDFSNNVTDLQKDERITSNMEVSMSQKDFKDIVTTLKNTAQGNDEYRRFINYHIARVLKARREGWSDELYGYIMKESIGSIYNYINAKARTDANLKKVLTEINRDARYQKCNTHITVDAKMMNDPNMQIFICDRMEYVMGADIYRYRESELGVVKDYTKRKKESTDLYSWLFQRATTDKAGFIMMADFNHNAGNKANEVVTNVNRGTNWYVFLFYKGLLYYSNVLQKCDVEGGTMITYKE